MLSRRGEDSGYKIKYRKNITGLKFAKEDTNVITRLRPMRLQRLNVTRKIYRQPAN
ncbi:MAG: hypothetical protein HFJ52_04030 [Clostridia bacterium]|nr:hypothetical protein [Clostridia bacterium]